MEQPQRPRTAGQELLGIIELVEQILLTLPEREILRLQQVSQFHAVTKGSVLLQRRLFLEPDPSRAAKPRCNPLFFHSAGEDHPFFSKLQPALRSKPIKTHYSSPPRITDMTAGKDWTFVLHPGEKMPRLFPLGFKKMLCLTGVDVASDGLGTLEFDVKYVRNQSHADELRLVSGTSVDEGSWEQMLLFQPPVPFGWSANFADGSILHAARTLAPDTTLGDLVKQTRGLGW